MRLWSSHESVRRGEPTVLAILEALVAMSASVWIGIHFGTWMHVAVGAAIAPLLLLRTDESYRIVSRLVQEPGFGCVVVGMTMVAVGMVIGVWVGVVIGMWVIGMWVGVVMGVCVGVGIGMWVGVEVALGLGIRFAATLAEMPHGHLRMIRAVPGNWWRAVMATDFVESPELLPAPMGDSSSDTEGEEGVYNYLKNPIDFVGLLPYTLIAFAYRLSLKSTALVWFPLLWALRPVKPANLDWRTHLEIGADLGKTRLVGAVSAVCIFLLVAKYVLWTGRHELALEAQAWLDLLRSWNPSLADSALAEGLVGYVRPGAFPLWQVATFFNSLLGLFVWWKVRKWLAYFRHDLPPSEESISRTLAVTFFFRRILTSYAIVCNGFMALQLARRLPVPQIGWRMFPWV